MRQSDAFSLNPSQGVTGVLDFRLKHHRAIYNQAVEPLYADTKDRYNLDALQAQALLQKIRDRCNQAGIDVVLIPLLMDAFV